MVKNVCFVCVKVKVCQCCVTLFGKTLAHCYFTQEFAPSTGLHVSLCTKIENEHAIGKAHPLISIT